MRMFPRHLEELLSGESNGRATPARISYTPTAGSSMVGSVGNGQNMRAIAAAHTAVESNRRDTTASRHTVEHQVPEDATCFRTRLAYSSPKLCFSYWDRRAWNSFESWLAMLTEPRVVEAAAGRFQE